MKYTCHSASPDPKLCDAGPHNCRSYGAVYRAERRADDTEVAVKIIPADNPVDLLKEVDIMMACTSPYIVRLHDCFYKVRQIRAADRVQQQAMYTHTGSGST